MSELVTGQESLSNAAALAKEHIWLVQENKQLNDRKEQYKRDNVLLREASFKRNLVMSPETEPKKRKLEGNATPNTERGESLH